MKRRRKIAVLGALSDLNPAYSIAGVVLDQIRMLVAEGETVVFITTSDFNCHDQLPAGVEVRTFPRKHGFNEHEIPLDEFQQYAFEAGAILASALCDITHCLTHDVMFLRGFLWVCWALREAQPRVPHVKFFHWVHSGPSKPPANWQEYPLVGCYTPLPNSVYVYPNRWDVPRVAEMFHCPEADVRTVYNTVDQAELFGYHPLSRKLLKDFNLLEADHVCVYPTRICDGKQPGKVVRLMAEIAKQGREVRLVFCNSWSNASSVKAEIASLKNLAESVGLSHIYFTSEVQWPKDEFDIELGVPKKVVTDLLNTADLFVLPSVSETASLVMLEAALTKNLLVLNQDLMPMQEFMGQVMDDVGSGRAVMAQFGSVTRPVGGYLPDEDTWWRILASKVISASDSDRAMCAYRYVRKHHNPHAVWCSQLGPLLASL